MQQFSLCPSGRRWRCPTPLILVVDDNRDAADVLALLLRRWRYRVIVAYNGATALQRTKAEWPTLAIVDVNMPLMSGVELARGLRRRAQGRLLPVYALTAVDWSVSGTLKHDFDAYLLKPVDEVLLRQQLEHDCSKAAGHSALN